MRSFSIGVIALWSGSIATIPRRWALCDGTNGTPDLRNSFVVAAGDTYNPADSAGSVNHTHDFTANGHSHSFTFGSGLDYGFNIEYDTDVTTLVGTTDADSVLAPYYALCYIMEL